MKNRCFAVIIAAFISFCVPAYAQQDVENMLRAVVRVHSIVPGNARTARFLGTEREGSGVVIDSNGLILTIGYLILEAVTTEIVGPDGEPVKATIVAYDHNTGFGLLRSTRPLKVPHMKLGQSSEVKENDPVLVASHGGPESVVGARVVARKEFAGSWEYLLEDAIFTTPPHPNFGGAALIGRDGRLMGIGSLYSPVVLPGVGVVPSNMFVPIDRLKPILSDLISTGRSSEPPHPWLGLNAGETRGRLFVQRVSSGGPAEKAGILPEDIILKVDKKAVIGLAQFYREVWALGKAGVDVPLIVLQGTRIREIIIHSSDRNQFLRLNR
jgi:S1-C subfamily serine protease